VGEKGTAFFLILILVIVSVTLVGAFLSTSLAKVRHTESRVAETSAFNAAESGLNVAAQEVWILYRDAPPADRVATLDRLDGKFNEADQYRIVGRDVGRSRFTVEVRQVRVSGSEYADVVFVSRGDNIHASKTIRAAYRYTYKPSQVFDHGYFVNNFGWLYGAGITVNGSVRANGNFQLANATVNGDILASENEELGVAGTISGDSRHDPIDYYNEHMGTNARPTNPSAPTEDSNGNGVLDAGEDRNGNGELDEFEFEDGYDGESRRREGLSKLDMPYLGDLSVYRELALKKGGTIKKGGSVVVDAVLGDAAGEDRDLILIGTADDPIIIDGPVVIENDVVLRGVIAGQGTIYAGRNVHIIGDLTYRDPPSWPKPMEDPEAVAAANASRDLVGLAAKGSLILGDYTSSGWLSVTKKYHSPPFTQPYVVDPTDAVNGYVTGNDPEGQPLFHGDYREFDGGVKARDGGGTEPRRYYESSFSDSQIRSLADEQVNRIDAVMYTNHLLSGKMGSATINGVLVSRDEAIIYNGSIDINYDIRIRHGAYEFLDVYLPREPTYRALFWSAGS
jgi:hypothetical protein